MPVLKIRPQWDLGNPPKVINQEIGNSEQGNLDTVQIMQQSARRASIDPRVRQLALRIIQNANIKSHNFIDEAVALATFVQQNVRYVRDPTGVEQLHDPVYLIEQLSKGSAQGDCDDQSLLLASLLLTIGAQPYFAIVRYNGTTGSYNHIYTVVYDKNWMGKKMRVPLDTIIKDRAIGFEVPYKSIREIMV
jgi:hypothetical protein